MLVVRLRRAGSKGRPFFRIVVTESAAARDGRFVEVLGHYNPRTKPEQLTIDSERMAHWLKAGARPSDTVRTLIDRMRSAGYLGRQAQSWAVGETLAWGSGELAEPAAIVDAWMRSRSHRRVLLSRAYREIEGTLNQPSLKSPSPLRTTFSSAHERLVRKGETRPRLPLRSSFTWNA